MHEKFHYPTLESLKETLNSLSLDLPFSDHTEVLKNEISFGSLLMSNRLGTAPMEGADSLPDGSPSSLTLRRYLRNVEGGSAVIWFEAISIVEEGRSGATQLLLNQKNLPVYQRMIEQLKNAGIKKYGKAPLLIMQANHSGRYSNPGNNPHPLIAYRHPIAEKLRPADDSCIVSDDYLKGLEEKFGEAAVLAKQAGFDAIDIKSCHGYLLAELLSAYERKGPYGGSYENRTRLFKNAIAAAKTIEDASFLVTARLGIYDGFPYPYGFGVNPDSPSEIDLSEPIRLVQELYHQFGIRGVNLTMGNPYVTTHVTRPFDAGQYHPEEHPLKGISRMIYGIGQVKKACPDMTVLASAPSYLRQYAGLFTAGAVEQGLCDGMLFGRMSFAYPNFADDLINGRPLDLKQICLTCGKCGDLIRGHYPTGCVVRDSGQYLSSLRSFQQRLPAEPLQPMMEDPLYE